MEMDGEEVGKEVEGMEVVLALEEVVAEVVEE